MSFVSQKTVFSIISSHTHSPTIYFLAPLILGNFRCQSDNDDNINTDCFCIEVLLLFNNPVSLLMHVFFYWHSSYHIFVSIWLSSFSALFIFWLIHQHTNILLIIFRHHVIVVGLWIIIWHWMRCNFFLPFLLINYHPWKWQRRCFIG